MMPTSAPTASEGSRQLAEASDEDTREGSSQTHGLLPYRSAMVWLAAFVLLTAAIAAWRWEIVDSPPYWDSAMGLFLEANFLAETGFDYARLWFEERRFIEGGSAIYLTSVLPTFVAVLMATLDSPRAVFVAYHLFTFACASAATLLVVAICRPWAGLLGAILIAAVVLTTPIFSAQIDMLGMDLPMLVLALLSAWCAIRKKYVWAAAVGCAAFATKMSGGLVLGALFVPLLLDLGLRYRSASIQWQRRIWLFMALALLSLAGVMLVDAWIGNLETSAVEQYEPNQSRGVTVMKDFVYWFPELVLLMGVALVAWPLVIASRIYALRKKGVPFGGALQRVLIEDPTDVYAWTIVLGMLLILSLTYTIPRYLILPLPFLWIIVGRLLMRGGQVSWLAAAPLAIVLGLNLANQDGRFYPAFPSEAKIDYRTGAILERSREYLPDHQANQRAVEYLQKHCADRSIMAGNPFVHLLALPRLGYVSEPLHGYSMSTYSTETFPTVEQLPHGEVRDPVFVHVSNRFNQNSLGMVPPPSADDIVLWQDDHRESPITIYEKLVNPLSTEEENKYRLISTVWPIERQFKLAKELVKQGEIDRAIQVYQTLLELDPNHHDARFALAGVQAAEGMHEQAAKNYRIVIKYREDVAQVHNAYADLLVRMGELEEAERQLWQAVSISPKNVTALRALGTVLLQQEDYREAAEAFSRATKQEPENARNWLMLSVARSRLGDRAGALAAVERSLAVNPALPEAHQELATQHVRSGDVNAAIHHFQMALYLLPNYDEAANKLAWILATWPDPAYRDGSQAVALMEPIINASSQTPGELDTLAAAYAEAGQYQQAIATAQRALELAQRQQNAELANRIAARLELYKQQRPYHAPAQ